MPERHRGAHLQVRGLCPKNGTKDPAIGGVLWGRERSRRAVRVWPCDEDDRERHKHGEGRVRSSHLREGRSFGNSLWKYGKIDSIWTLELNTFSLND